MAKVGGVRVVGARASVSDALKPSSELRGGHGPGYRRCLNLEPGRVSTCAWRTRALLSIDECERAARFARERDRQRFVVARGQLRSILGRHLRLSPQSVCLTHSWISFGFLLRSQIFSSFHRVSSGSLPAVYNSEAVRLPYLARQKSEAERYLLGVVFLCGDEFSVDFSSHRPSLLASPRNPAVP